MRVARSRELVAQGRPAALVARVAGISRQAIYRRPARPPTGQRRPLAAVDRVVLGVAHGNPTDGTRMVAALASRELAGRRVNRKRVQRLMRTMGLEAIYPRPSTTQRNLEHRIYPYLLRDVAILRPNQVWSTDITYIPLARGYGYLTAVLDWYSRYVLSWELSTTLDGEFCLAALEQALAVGSPEIFNTDQGSQFTSQAFTGRLERAGVAISMDGRGRALDNVFVERLWRSVKYEDVYLKEYPTWASLTEGLASYFRFYCHERPHQSLGNRTPAEVYHGS